MTDEQRTIKREKIFVDQSLTSSQIRKKYDLTATSSYVAKRKGFFVKNYGKRQIMIDRDQFDHDVAVKIANKVFKKNFYWNDVARTIKDDLVQEAIVRQFELSGKPQTNKKYSKNYQNMWTAHNAMISYLKTWVAQMRFSTVGELLDPEMSPIMNGQYNGNDLDFSWSYY
jgi:hypothetical protein